MSNTKVNQPNVIQHNGEIYYLDTPRFENADGHQSGPFYVKSEVKYTPDLAFLNGQSSEPLIMHSIQVHFA